MQFFHEVRIVWEANSGYLVQRIAVLASYTDHPQQPPEWFIINGMPLCVGSVAQTSFEQFCETGQFTPDPNHAREEAITQLQRQIEERDKRIISLIHPDYLSKQE